MNAQTITLYIKKSTISSLPVDTGRKLNVHKTFRRRPERLLNVLCTFNLRLVFTGFKEGRISICEDSCINIFKAKEKNCDRLILILHCHLPYLLQNY